MTLARKNNVELHQNNGRWTIHYRTGSITVTCKTKANNIYNELCKIA